MQNKTKQEKAKWRQWMHTDRGAHCPSELGRTWFAVHEPQIAWRTGDILKWGNQCFPDCFPSLPRPSPPAKPILSLNEWMNEWCIYIALFVYCCTPKALYSHVGGVSPQPPPVCSIHLDDATAATGQRRQCAHHTPATGGEKRES